MVPFRSFPFGQTPLASSQSEHSPNKSRWGVCITVDVIVCAKCACDKEWKCTEMNKAKKEINEWECVCVSFEGDIHVLQYLWKMCVQVWDMCGFVCVWGWKGVSGVVRHPESLNILLACVQLPAPSSSSCVCEALSWQPARLWSELKQTSVAAICWSWGINQTASRPPAIGLPWATAPARLPGATASLCRPTCGHSNPSQREERERERKSVGM